MKKPRIGMIACLFLVLNAGCSSGAAEDRYFPTAEEWETRSPEAAGMDARRLDEMFAYAEEEDLLLHGMLIVKNGRIVAERYDRGYSEGRKHGVFSVTKSIMSAVVGAAIQDKLIGGADDRAMDYFPDMPIENLNDAKRATTIKQLLSMSSGMADWPEYRMCCRPSYRSSRASRRRSTPGSGFLPASG
jgi:CubicO group peptidase (beta-lactamase class C family)